MPDLVFVRSVVPLCGKSARRQQMRRSIIWRANCAACSFPHGCPRPSTGSGGSARRWHISSRWSAGRPGRRTAPAAVGPTPWVNNVTRNTAGGTGAATGPVGDTLRAGHDRAGGVCTGMDRLGVVIDPPGPNAWRSKSSRRAHVAARASHRSMVAVSRSACTREAIRAPGSPQRCRRTKSSAAARPSARTSSRPKRLSTVVMLGTATATTSARDSNSWALRRLRPIRTIAAAQPSRCPRAAALPPGSRRRATPRRGGGGGP